VPYEGVSGVRAVRKEVKFSCLGPKPRMLVLVLVELPDQFATGVKYTSEWAMAIAEPSGTAQQELPRLKDSNLIGNKPSRLKPDLRFERSACSKLDDEHRPSGMKPA
jgi:hypothetical protein